MRTAAIALLLVVVSADPTAPEKLGRLDHGPIREASGIVASRRHPGIFWVHNDSGNPPALYAVRRDGSLVREFRVAAPNVDWEDIAIDDDGRLYLGDIGNNGGRLPIRAIYRIDEPDPDEPAGAPLKPTRTWYYRFPEGRRFDAEGLFLDGGRAILVSKHLDGREAELFALPLDATAPLLRPALPEKVGTLPGFQEPATGADLSAEGRLAVCSPRVTRVYERVGDAWKPIGEVRYPPEPIEAIAWDGDDLVLASEGRDLYRIAESAWRSTAGVEGR